MSLASVASSDVVPKLGVKSLAHVLQHVILPTEGVLVECGVWTGTTMNRIADAYPDRIVYGFDSFQGLPEDWREGYPAGFFETGGNKPEVRQNVNLVPGWFEDTLPLFAQQLTQSGTEIALLHVDCDLYSSTVTCLRTLAPLMPVGGVVVFDELVNYPGFEEHEVKALEEYLEESGRTFGRRLSRCISPGGDPPSRADPRLEVHPILRERGPPEVPGFEDAAPPPERREKCLQKDVEPAQRRRLALQTLQTVVRRGHAGEAEDRIDPRKNLKDSDPSGRHAASPAVGVAAQLLRLRPVMGIVLFLFYQSAMGGFRV
ncbi:hypothetical protein CEUSTIGMA_g12180.t1 [Chlamydomonas eustigma]|uniref:Uncharacterized protein n=1 Tax=Chlamydomonas eustigma TaxID=1157962 RepID=A0A250XNV9_9CHLO|nr:hypothetical protein CEUSTIGMA_g12180.t1 [Chlamydomonas eustigma]|eukprot:GAX84758.1 hypothetical protein CEUSTIGMA_g12180.t1 [Chlamydomonas eustigma]